MNDALTFGRWVKQLRAEQDLTQEILAERVGCAAQTIRMFESGLRRPSRDLAERLADILNVPLAKRAEFTRLARTKNVVDASAAPDQSIIDPTPLTVRTFWRPGLPSAPNPLLGREREHRELRALLLDPRARLVTLLGPGGVGKTRLALQVAEDLAANFPDGVAWVSLASVVAAEQVPTTVADALGIARQGGDTATDQVIHTLHDLKLMLVLDNFEHLLEAGTLLLRIIQQAPGVRLLVTSRERLRLQAEWIVELGGLATPKEDTSEQILASEAVLLFLERARRTQNDFVLGPNNQAIVAQICRRLDGLPLALELAAARVKLLSPTALLMRLDKVLPLLAGGARDLPERHRTMRATIAWSYDLLNPDEQALFRRLAVFAGGWTLENAEIVGADDEFDAEALLDLMASLVDKSLVVAETQAAGLPRYRMLEPIRQFALSMLEAAGEVDMIARRHFALFLDFAEQARPKLRGPHEAIWLAHLDRENDNLRAAMAWALTIGAYEGAVRLSWALLYFWWTRSRFDEAHQAMEQVLDKAVGISLTLRIRAAIIAQAMAYGQADHAAVDRHIREVLTLSAQAGGDLYGDAFGTLGLGLAAMTRGQHDIALERMEQSLPLLETADEPAIVAQVYTFLGTTLMLDGQYDAAAQRFEQALLLANKIKDWQSIYNAHYNLAQLALAQHDYDLAAQRFAQGVPLSLERGDLVNIAFCLEGLVVVAGARGQAERAARLLGAAESLIERVGIRGHTYYMPDRSLFARIIADVQLQLGETAFAAARQAGRAMQFEQVIADVHLHHA